ncbi:MAG: DUF86 domain-containing protein [Defluviitaleaceae bacterium]|nr:DUF86 domain-containing protein [Defluviitaleaceae bacterium]
MKKDNTPTLKSILKYCERIGRHIENLGLTKDNFYESEVGKDAVSMCLQTIGEYLRTLDDNFKEKYNKIMWKDAIGMRNRFAHGYDGMNEEIIWLTASEYVPELKEYVEKILEENRKD